MINSYVESLKAWADTRKMMTITNTKKLSGLADLNVYQATYAASVTIMTDIVPKLPARDPHDLSSKISRSCNAIPGLIAGGYASRNQYRIFQRHLDGAIAEINKLAANLSHCNELYRGEIDARLCERLIDIYEKSARQLFLLSETWDEFSPRRRTTSSNSRRGGVNEARAT